MRSLWFLLLLSLAFHSATVVAGQRAAGAAERQLQRAEAALVHAMLMEMGQGVNTNGTRIIDPTHLPLFPSVITRRVTSETANSLRTFTCNALKFQRSLSSGSALFGELASNFFVLRHGC